MEDSPLDGVLVCNLSCKPIRQKLSVTIKVSNTSFRQIILPNYLVVYHERDTADCHNDLDTDKEVINEIG